MKALLLADLYQAWINCKFYLLFVAVAAFVVATTGGTDDNNTGSFMSVYPMVMCSMIGMSLTQLDEASHWNIYSQALPATRRDQVTSKYAVSLVCFGGVWALFALIFVTLALLGRMAWAMAGFQMTTLASLGLLAPAFSLPTIFRWGTNKGRVIFIAVIVAVGFGVGFLYSTFPFDSPSLPSISGPVLIVLAVLVSVALFIGSWALAVRWYEKREL